jgi:hypothetical protein
VTVTMPLLMAVPDLLELSCLFVSLHEERTKASALFTSSEGTVVPNAKLVVNMFGTADSPIIKTYRATMSALDQSGGIYDFVPVATQQLDLHKALLILPG